MVLASCTSMKSVSVDQATIIQPSKNYIVLHTPNKLYKLNDYKFSNDTLIGELNKFSGSKTGVIHVYTNMVYDIDFDSGSFKNLKLHKSNIQKVTFKKFSFAKTATLIGGIVLGGVFLANNIYLDFGQYELGF